VHAEELAGLVADDVRRVFRRAEIDVAAELECARSGVLGTRAGMVIISAVLVWVALHYFLAARTLRRDLVIAIIP
jgi:hypothetical protein